MQTTIQSLRQKIAAGAPRHRSKRLSGGFTIIEVMIVLAIAGTILAIVFIAVPALQRNTRNTERLHDVSLLDVAIQNCLLNHSLVEASCDSPAEVQFNTSEFSIFTGYHYGASGGSTTPVCSGAPNPSCSSPVIPTTTEPNWLFGLQCNSDGSFFTDNPGGRTYIVSYNRENSNGTYTGRCVEGTY